MELLAFGSTCSTEIEWLTSFSLSHNQWYNFSNKFYPTYNLDFNCGFSKL